MSLRLKRKRECENSLNIGKLNTLKNEFNKNKINKLIQNSLCTNSLHRVSEKREYMQSRDNEFSHTLDPVLEISNQGLSGRCWLFAVLNVMRHELIRKFELNREFELSESYVCFYEKLEKCNYFLTQILDYDSLDLTNEKLRLLLACGCQDGGFWISCVNLIEKYGIIPQSCYRESLNSFSTSTMNEVLDTKLREFATELTNEPDKKKRILMKEKMMEQIYSILCKLLGTPPNPNEKFNWSFSMYMDLSKQIEREQKRQHIDGHYENLQVKNTFEITPLEFYSHFIVNKFNDYISLGNDPRNQYHKYYQSFDNDIVIEGKRNGYYNVPIEILSNTCIRSIMDNTPVEFSCDVRKYLNIEEELLDNKCYDFKLVFDDDFDKLTKEQSMKCYDSHATHAMVFVGVDLDNEGNPLKWKVENSWGRHENSNGYYTMSHEWFKRYVFDVVVQNKYIEKKLLHNYDTESKNPITLPEYDVMA
jgi:bleomycin hydrolase